MPINPDTASDPLILCRLVAHGSPYAMALFEGQEHALRYANPAFFELAEQEEVFLLGKPVGECLPKCPGCVPLLSRVSHSGRTEHHTEEGYSESWNYAAWRVSLPVALQTLTMLLITETSELHRRATMINEALMVSAVQQHELAEVTEASAKELSAAMFQKGEELDHTKEELRSLASQLLQAEEDERRRIARELHDGFSQQLASLAMQVFHLGQEVATAEGHLMISRIQNQLGALSGEVRALSHQLHPPALDHLGLVTSLRALQEDFESTHAIPIRLLVQEFTIQLSLQAATTLYRIVQESLWNIVKHAGNDALVTIQLSQDTEHLTLRIEDTGTGFDPGVMRSKGGLGLISMQERARLIGGLMTVDSAPGEGTKLCVRVPLA